jgi:hypothetical protein
MVPAAAKPAAQEATVEKAVIYKLSGDLQSWNRHPLRVCVEDDVLRLTTTDSQPLTLNHPLLPHAKHSARMHLCHTIGASWL